MNMKPYYDKDGITIYNGDCLEVMRQFEDNSFDLIVADPPYNIGKSKKWDKWEKQSDYIDWCGEWILACQRILKNNGSFYFFHNNMPQIAMLMEWIRKKTRFIFKQFIVWNKRFEGAKNKGYLDGFVKANNRKNYEKMAEYILFYISQDDTGLTNITHDIDNFQGLRKYFYDMLCWMGENIKSINEKKQNRKAEHCFYVMPKKRIIDKIGQSADHCFRYGSTQWNLPTRETYQKLIDIFGINKWENFREYEDLQYTFNNQKTHHSVWNYETAEKMGHITTKPLALIENIVKHSTNKKNLILDPFMGSGTTLVAAKELGRRAVGIEIELKYCEIAVKRLKSVQPYLIT